MARLIYSSAASLDGYVADEDGNFDWAAPDEEVHAVVNDLERPIGSYLYGLRMEEDSPLPEPRSPPRRTTRSRGARPLSPMPWEEGVFR